MKVPNHLGFLGLLEQKHNAEETSKKGYSANGGDISKGEYPEIPPEMNENKKEIPLEMKQDSGISRRNNKHSEKLDLEGPSNP